MRCATIANLAFSATIPATAHPLQDFHAKGNVVETIYQFPNETWIENLAVRCSGQILVTLLSSPEVWQIDPAHPGSAELIYHFPQALSVLGIAEVRPDIFAVAVGNITVSTIASTPGSYSIWSIDLRAVKNKKKPKRVSKITDYPHADFLNGISTLPGRSNSILLADSAQGLIYELDTKTRASKIWLDDPALKPNSSIAVKSGVNGLQARNGYVYFTNTFANPVLARVPITAFETPSGPVETIVGEPTYGVNIGDQADDFTFDAEGNIWLATDPSNAIVKVTPNRTVTTEVGGVGDAVVAGITALKFGRGMGSRRKLYGTTNGGIAYPPPSVGVVGGKVVRVDVDRL